MNTLITALTAVLIAAMSYSPARSEDISGKVMETMSSGGYTYMRLKTPSGDRWAAVTQTATTKATVKKGAMATVINTMDMKDFESPTLKRKFAHIAFGLSGSTNLQAATTSAPQAPAPVASAADPVAKTPSPDCRTIADIHTQKKSLVGKEVVVCGKIVKINAHILGHNWAHLNDGTGDAKDGSDDLMIILKDEVSLSEVITARGKVVLNKDLEGIFLFPVALEDSVLVK